MHPFRREADERLFHTHKKRPVKLVEGLKW
jgi:hypothetical protein